VAGSAGQTANARAERRPTGETHPSVYPAGRVWRQGSLSGGWAQEARGRAMGDAKDGEPARQPVTAESCRDAGTHSLVARPDGRSIGPSPARTLCRLPPVGGAAWTAASSIRPARPACPASRGPCGGNPSHHRPVHHRRCLTPAPAAPPRSCTSPAAPPGRRAYRGPASRGCSSQRFRSAPGTAASGRSSRRATPG